MNWLLILGLLPLVGVFILAALPTASELLAKRVALNTTLVVAGVAIAMATQFQRDNVDPQFVRSYSWIPTFGINFAVGIDGIALVLILLSALLAPVVVLAGWNEANGGRWSVKTFYILLLVLETMVIGVFSASDVFLFYVFFEAMLVSGLFPNWRIRYGRSSGCSREVLALQSFRWPANAGFNHWSLCSLRRARWTYI